MSQRNTFTRSLHDLSLAAWFGGTLMGAVGLNGGAATARDPKERLRISSAGWKLWAPLQMTALIAHAIGGAGQIWGNKARLAAQKEGRTNTTTKLVITLAAAAATGYAGILGKKINDHADEGATGTTEPSETSSTELASAQRQQKIFQWVAPVLTGVLIVLAAQQGEQQRPLAGLLGRK